MTYYLGLVGLGLFFVLLVYLYNRWTFFVYRKTFMASEGNEYQSASPPPEAAKVNVQPPKAPPFALDATVVGNINGMAAEQIRAMKDNVSPPAEHLLKGARVDETKTISTPINPLESNTTQGLLAHQSFFVLGLDKLTAEEFQGWLTQLRSSSPFVVSIECLANNKQWYNAWTSDLLGNAGQRNALLTAEKWTPLVPIMQVEVLVQLANRRGHLTIEDWQLIENCAKGKAPATIAGSEAVLPIAPLTVDKMQEVSVHITALDQWLMRARDLDQLCAEYDVQIALTLKCRESSGVSGGQISRESSLEGMVFERGLFCKFSSEGLPQFTLEFSPNGEMDLSLDELENRIGDQVTLCLDLPKVTNGQKVFQDMVRFAQHFSAVIRADLVDDRGHQLSSISLDTIAEQIGRIQGRMKEAGLIAGSPLAIQLFS
jgi:hypothetical protein